MAHSDHYCFILLIATTYFAFVLCSSHEKKSSILNLKIEPTEKTIFTDELYSFKFEIHRDINSTSNFSLSTSTSYAKVGQVMKCSTTNKTSVEVNDTLIFVTHGICEVKGLRLGETFITLRVEDPQEEKNSVEDTFHLIVVRLKGVKDTAYRVCMIIIITVSTLSMGCGLDIYAMLSYAKKPFAPAVGFVSQFLFMPLIALTLAEVTQLEKSFGFGLLTIGCSPGGGGSNLWTALFGGDLNLSMTMTFISTIAAFGMMPFWLFVLGRLFVDTEKIQIPFDMILINLSQIVIPILVGLFIKWWKPKLAQKIYGVIKIFGVIFVIFIFTVGTWVNLYMYELMGDYPTLLPIGAALPWIGFIFGFSFALLLRQSRKKAITISLETGIQNIGVPILILLYSFPEPQGSLAGILPVIVALFTPIPLTLILIGLTIYRKFVKKESTVHNEEVEETKEKSENKGVENDSYAVSMNEIANTNIVIN